MPNVAINGLGRIGRAALKVMLDGEGLNLVAVNDLADADNLAYLLKYDTVYGRYHRESSPPTARWSLTAARSRRSPNATRRTCPGTRSMSTWCSSAPAPSRQP